MSKIKLFLKRIGRFFDKKLITPLSKLFVKINELLKSNNKNGFNIKYSGNLSDKPNKDQINTIQNKFIEILFL